MSVQVLFDAARSAIKQHNDVVGEGSPGFVNPDAFIDALKVSGFTSFEVLSKLSFEKFTAMLPFVEIGGEKKPMSGLAEAIGKAVRFAAKVDEPTKEEKVNVNPGAKKVRQMSNRQLVEAYDPAENNEVSKRLAEISKGQPFVVFKTGRIINVEATLVLLDELKQGYSPRQFYEVDGLPQEVQPLGYIPDNYADENPLYLGRPTRPDGTCDQTNRSWAGIEHQVKQFLRVGLDMGIIKISRIEDAHYFMDMAMLTDAMKTLRQRYAAVSVQFDKLVKEGKLPTLKISLTLPKVKTNGGNKTSPFDGGKQVQWVAPLANQNYYRSWNLHEHERKIGGSDSPWGSK